jgi:beta-glucosidase
MSAVESTVLLDNDGILPLDKAKVKTVLVTGPMADSPYEQMGTWSMDGEGSRTVTPLKALKDLYGDDVRIIYEPGIESCLDKAGKGVGKALAAARKADVVLAFIGELAIMSGEAHSLAEITLKGDQRAFLEALYKTGTPVVLTVMAGRPLELGFELDHSDAILYSFHPGTMGGPALAQLIFGDETPSGKTPVSFPKSRGQIPVYYNHNMTGRPYRGETLLDEYQASGRQTSLGGTSVWLDSGLDPQFPFGHGLTYTTFEYSALKLDQVEYGMDDTIIAEVMITNTGNRKATEVMQLYVRDLVGSVTRPVKELKGFKRITLEPGETKTVKFGLPVQNLAFYGQDMVKKVETGDFHLWIGGNSASGVPVAFSVY